MLEESARQPDLTERQREILLAVTRGLTNSEIATQFGITVSGVKKHLNAIFAKFGAANRAEAVATALKGDALSQGEAGPGIRAESPATALSFGIIRAWRQ